MGEVVNQLGGRRQGRGNEGIGARRRRTMERRITERMEGGRDEVEVKSMGKA